MPPIQRLKRRGGKGEKKKKKEKGKKKRKRGLMAETRERMRLLPVIISRSAVDAQNCSDRGALLSSSPLLSSPLAVVKVRIEAGNSEPVGFSRSSASLVIAKKEAVCIVPLAVERVHSHN